MLPKWVWRRRWSPGGPAVLGSNRRQVLRRSGRQRRAGGAIGDQDPAIAVGHQRGIGQAIERAGHKPAQVAQAVGGAGERADPALEEVAAGIRRRRGLGEHARLGGQSGEFIAQVAYPGFEPAPAPQRVGQRQCQQACGWRKPDAARQQPPGTQGQRDDQRRREHQAAARAEAAQAGHGDEQRREVEQRVGPWRGAHDAVTFIERSEHVGADLHAGHQARVPGHRC